MTVSLHSRADDLRATYDDLLRTLALLESEEIEHGQMENGWSPKMLLAHVAFWDRIQATRIENAIAGAHTGQSRPAATNDEQAAFDDQRTLEVVLSDADAARGDLIRVATLEPGLLAQSYVEEATAPLVPVLLLDHMVEHTRLHTRDLRQYCGSMRRWTKASLRAFLVKQDANLMDSIGRLSEHVLTAPALIGDQSIRDVLVHILAWREYGYLVLRAWPSPNLSDLGPWLDGDTDVINARLRDSRAPLNMIDIADGLTTYHRRMLKILNQADDALLASRGSYGWRDEGELSGFLFELTCHEMEHAEDIWRFRVDKLGRSDEGGSPVIAR